MKCASGICTSRDQQCMARGLRQNISEQCSFQKDSCLISCTDPKDSRNCLMLSGMFLDGTECGLAGFCHKGTCVGTGACKFLWIYNIFHFLNTEIATVNTLKAWTAQNMAIAIPVYIFGSIGVLLILGWIIWYIRRRYKRKILLSEKDKDSRPNSIISYPPLAASKSPTTVNTTVLPNHTMKRDSQIVPFPINSIPSSLLQQHQSHNIINATTAEIELENLSIPTNNSNNLNDLVNTSNNNNNNNNIVQASSRRNTLFLPSTNNTNSNDHRSSIVGTHRRGKSNIE